MPGKKFQAQLEKLLSSDQDPIGEPDPGLASAYPGWVWECDQDHRFTYCSNEIEQALGIQAVEFSGKDLLSYQLDPGSKEALSQAFQDLDQPKSILVNYRHKSGVYLPVSLYILGRWDNDLDHSIVRGFSQLCQVDQTTSPGERTVEDGLEHIQATIPDQTQIEFSKIRVANQLVLEILKHILDSNPTIRKARQKQIISLTEHKLVSDQTVDVTQTLSTDAIQQAPGRRTTVSRLEHRLEWGAKLDLTGEEEEFIAKNLYQEESFVGKMRQQRAAKSIQKADKYWIGVLILAGEEQPSRILVQADQSLAEIQSFTLQEFLDDPLILVPVLRQAVEHPMRVEQVYQRGVDYLVPR